jgi:hypothetical protein
MSLSLIVLATAGGLLLLALASVLVTGMTERRKLYRIQAWMDQIDGRITYNADGLFISKASNNLSVAWNELSKVELVWEENPFEDPQFGRYCDTDWLLWSRSGTSLTLSESVNDSNSRLLLEAFARFLPGFNFDYAQFKASQKNRIFELQGGRVVVWTRVG